MPHDINGKVLKVSDVVLIPCKVNAIHITEEYCNVELETNLGMYPNGTKTSIILNSQQTILKEK